MNDTVFLGILKYLMATRLEEADIEAVICEEVHLLEIIVKQIDTAAAINAVAQAFGPVSCVHTITAYKGQSLISFHVSAD